MSRKSKGKPATLATAPAQTRADIPVQPSRGMGASLWLGGLLCGGVVVLAPASAILLLGLLMPLGLVALIPDRHGSGKLVQAALLFGLAGSVSALRSLWEDGASTAAALSMLRQPTTLFTSWIATLGGWMVSECAAMVLRLHADIAASAERRVLMQQITAIEEEWGPMPASAPLPPMQ